MEGNNMNAEAAHLRDTFLKAEEDYVLFLLKDDEIKSFIKKLNMYDGEELFSVAQELVDKVEMNLIPKEKMELVEKQLIVLLAAIKDVAREKTLIRTPDYENEQSRGRSR